MSKTTDNASWADEQVARGRWPVRGILAVGAFLFFNTLLALVAGGAGALFPSILPVFGAVFLFFWYRGYNWARIISGLYFAILTVLSTFSIIFLLLIGASPGETYLQTFILTFLGMLFSILFGAASYGLFRSNDMKAYIWHLGEKRKQQEKRQLEELEAELYGKPDE